jgi:cytochrome oxidase Cu insertion factor (SCO1/SenC/PrrC family)
MTNRTSPVIDRRQFLQNGSALALAGGLAASTLWPGAAWGQSGPPPSEAKAPPLPEVGTPLKLPTVSLFDGTVFHPAQAEGQVLLVYWWASTCPFCALQSPDMQKLWLKHQAHGLQMVALSVDRKKEDALPYLKKHGYTFPAGWVTPEVQAVLPKPKGLPITLVRGKDGRVLQAEKGQMFPEDVELLAKWLG